MNKSSAGRGDGPGLFFEPSAQQRLEKLPPLLLAWYDRHARVLPWRSNPTPYRVWISEMMLQQTRVEAAKGYFERFLASLPDVHALAAVEDDALLKLWEGLGYYRRANHIKRTAQIIVSEYGGEIPSDPALLRMLPGIGDYSSGSISSIAYGVRVPAVDGNVLRVISRILASEADVTLPGVKRDLTALVAGMLPDERVGDFNQSLMELGATVCLPNGAPLCLCCPVQTLCEGYAKEIAADLPKRTAKKPRTVQQITAFYVTREKTLCGAVPISDLASSTHAKLRLQIIEQRDAKFGKPKESRGQDAQEREARTAAAHFALRKRPEQGLLAGLWELPNCEGALSPAEAKRWLEEQGLIKVDPVLTKTGKHIFSHVEWRITLYTVALPPDVVLPQEWVEASPEDLIRRYPLPSAFLSLLKNL